MDSDVIKDTRSSWSLVGDLNATVSAAERNSDNVHARISYTHFLRDVDGVDLWERMPDRSRFLDWTCRGWGSLEGGNIIDRVVVSKADLADFGIHTDPTWIPGSDHRAIMANVVLKSNTGGSPRSRPAPFVPFKPSPPPRIKFPKNADKNKFLMFADEVDRLIASDPSFNAPVVDDESYVTRYSRLTSILDQSTTRTFGRHRPFQHQIKRVISLKIRAVVSKI
ncbi:hypothetical protein C0992_004076 [Termitomyces sp. T32_za158]|nr:hypothetical protein C0992_004076 [Termitomyces sp. T32_za158]